MNLLVVTLMILLECVKCVQGVQSVEVLTKGIVVYPQGIQILVTLNGPASEDVFVKLESEEETKYTSCVRVGNAEYLCWTVLNPGAWFIRTVKADGKNYQLKSSVFVIVWSEELPLPKPTPTPDESWTVYLYLPSVNK